MRTVLLSLIFSVIPFVKPENKVILNHSSGSEFLILKCNISDASCCKNMKEVEFFKNGDGVCTVTNCKGGCTIPLSREDTEFYKCGCAERDIRNTYIHVTKYRHSDNGNWTCGCYGKENGRKCHSSVMVISKETFDKDVAIINEKSTTFNLLLPFLTVCIALVLVVIIVPVILLYYLRWTIRKKVKVKRSTYLTRFLFGKKGNSERKEYSEQKLLPASTDNSEFAQRQLHSPIETEQLQGFVTDLLKKTKQSSKLSYVAKEFLILVYRASFGSTVPEWCQCGHCQTMEKNYQPICCRQCGVGEECFSKSEEFVSKCLKRKALLKFFQSVEEDESIVAPGIANYLKNTHRITEQDCKDGDTNDKKTIKAFRAQAYNNCKVILPTAKKDMYFPVPSCCKIAIRKVFPDPDNEYES